MLRSQSDNRVLKVAIVSDTMVASGGAERVVDAFGEAFPDAPVFSVLYDPEHGPRGLQHRITQSWLGRIPGAARFAKALMFLYPNAIESFDLSEFDIILSSHHTLAKGVLRTSEQIHVCYCHTPMRSLWERPHDEIRRVPPILRPLFKAMTVRLRAWDLSAASRVDYFVANSQITAERIAKHYRRRSVVVQPPIDTERFVPSGPPQDYYLCAARNVPYKRIDLAIAAAERLGRKLIVVGDGTDRLAYASSNVSFYGKVTDEKLIGLMSGARGLLFPQSEDFGMTVLETNACGRPVIAYASGGALETVIDGKTGVLFREQSVDGLVEAIERFESLHFDSAEIRMHAERFSKARFIKAIRDVVSQAVVRESPRRATSYVSSIYEVDLQDELVAAAI